MTQQTMTVKTKPKPMNLTLVVLTMLMRQKYHFTRGDKALAALHRYDSDPFTVDVSLTNRVPDPEGRTELRDTPFGKRLFPREVDVLVWRSTNTLPRWATQAKDARLRAEAALARSDP